MHSVALQMFPGVGRSAENSLIVLHSMLPEDQKNKRERSVTRKMFPPFPESACSSFCNGNKLCAGEDVIHIVARNILRLFTESDSQGLTKMSLNLTCFKVRRAPIKILTTPRTRGIWRR